MLSPIQRRQRVFSIKDSPQCSPAAKIVAQCGMKMMESCAEGMGDLLREGLPERKKASNGHRFINALIKPVGDGCNLRCRYCFNRSSRPIELMTDDVLESVVSQVLEWSPDGAFFILHGGEPLLAGIGFFQRLIQLQNRYARAGQTIRNSITTNGTLLNEPWGRFFSEHSFNITVSLDGPPDNHDANRVDAGGRGSLTRVLKGIRTAQAGGLDVRTISVVTCPPVVSAQELFEFITALGIRRWRANPCRSLESVNCYGEYVEGLFDAWCDDGGKSHIAIISDVLRGLMGYIPRTCWMTGSCETFLGFDPDGTVSPCCEISIDPEYHFGNILQRPLREILQGPTAVSFWAERRKGDRHCSGCEWKELCAGGCTYLRIQHGGSPAGKDYLCEAYQDTFRRLAAKVDYILSEAAGPRA